jgi:hypothetical protein
VAIYGEQYESVVRSLRSQLDHASGSLQSIATEIAAHEQVITKAQALAALARGAQILLQNAAGLSRRRLRELIEPLLTKALQLLLGGKAAFRIDFDDSKEVPTAQFVMVDHRGVEGVGIDAYGGGLVDIESLLLRLIVLQRSRLPKILIADEPFRNIHGADALKVISSFVHRLAADLGYQVILVTGDEAIAPQETDKTLWVTFGADGSTVSEEMI